MNIFLIVIAVFFLIIFWSLIHNKKFKKKLQDVSNNRTSLNKEEFVNIFIQKGYKQEQIEVSYNELSKISGLKTFQMYPEDDIYKLYDVDPEDFSFMIMDIAKKLKLELPSQIIIDPINEEFKNKMTFEFILKILQVSIPIEK